MLMIMPFLFFSFSVLMALLSAGQKDTDDAMGKLKANICSEISKGALICAVVSFLAVVLFVYAS